MHIHSHSHTHLHMHTLTHSHMHILTHSHMHTLTHTHTHSLTHRYRKRFVASAEKLHTCHNNYSLSILNANAHQEHYRTSLLPFCLDILQERMELQISEWCVCVSVCVCVCLFVCMYVCIASTVLLITTTTPIIPQYTSNNTLDLEKQGICMLYMWVYVCVCVCVCVFT